MLCPLFHPEIDKWLLFHKPYLIHLCAYHSLSNDQTILLARTWIAFNLKIFWHFLTLWYYSASIDIYFVAFLEIFQHLSYRWQVHTSVNVDDCSGETMCLEMAFSKQGLGSDVLMCKFWGAFLTVLSDSWVSFMVV